MLRPPELNPIKDLEIVLKKIATILPFILILIYIIGYLIIALHLSSFQIYDTGDFLNSYYLKSGTLFFLLSVILTATVKWQSKPLISDHIDYRPDSKRGIIQNLLVSIILISISILYITSGKTRDSQTLISENSFHFLWVILLIILSFNRLLFAKKVWIGILIFLVIFFLITISLIYGGIIVIFITFYGFSISILVELYNFHSKIDRSNIELLGISFIATLLVSITTFGLIVYKHIPYTFAGGTSHLKTIYFENNNYLFSINENTTSNYLTIEVIYENENNYYTKINDTTIRISKELVLVDKSYFYSEKEEKSK